MTPRVAKTAGLIGAFAGVAIGFFGVGLLAREGFHAIVLPAGLPGIIGGVVARQRSYTMAVAYAVIGLAAGLFTEWHYRPFLADKSWGYFVHHVGNVTPMVLGIIFVGAIIGGMFAFSIGRSVDRKGKNAQGQSLDPTPGSVPPRAS